MLKSFKTLVFLVAFLLLPIVAFASDNISTQIDHTSSSLGLFAISIFVIGYLLVMAEEFTHMRKSKPVMLAAGIMWVLVSLAYGVEGQKVLEEQLNHNLIEYVLLFLFLLAAMTYINTLAERNVFEVLRSWLVSKGFSLKKIFWITGLLAFCISPVADNLTTALVMGAVILTVAKNNPAFISLGCINIVVAANAGGAFSPFGDITTLLVWQSGKVEFATFFSLFIPSLVNWLVPAFIMSYFVPSTSLDVVEDDVRLKWGAVTVIVLFMCTIATAVSFHSFLHLPPAIGMMTGLSVLKIFGYFIRKHELHNQSNDYQYSPVTIGLEEYKDYIERNYKLKNKPFDSFISMKRAEWDTLLFFYGVTLCVGALGALGYLAVASKYLYLDLGPLYANSLVGIISAVIDNIPVMFAVLSMNPEMSIGHWLLVTLTAGVGGSLLSLGSAAGVALMGQAKGVYTFGSHLKWTPAIALGYVASIYTHLYLNQSLM